MADPPAASAGAAEPTVANADRSGNHKWWTLTAVSIALFMLLIDITVVNVALPDIQHSLGASLTDLQWVVDAYALGLASILLAAGSVADMIGRRLVFVLGLAIFTGASLTCGLAATPGVLNISRAVQGVGGGMMFATTLALIAQAFHGKDRATAFGVFGAVTGGAVAIGPLVGGVLTQHFGWSSIFLVNVPIGIGAIVLTMLRVGESKDPRGSRIDFGGLLTFSGALFLIVLTLIKANAYGWTSGRTAIQFAAAVALLIAFLWIELRHPHPLFDMSLFRKPAFVGASVVAFGISASMFAMFLFLTLYLQGVLDFEPLATGVRFLPITLMSFGVAPIAGRLTARIQPRVFLSVGLLLIGIGLMLMHGLTVSSGWTALLPGFIVAGAGIGMVNPPLASTAIGVVPPARSGMGSGINATFRQVGIATGIAALGAIFQHDVAVKVTQLLDGTPLAQRSHEISAAVAAGGSPQLVSAAPQQSRGLLEHVSSTAFVSGLNNLFVIGAVLALVSAAFAAVTIRAKDFEAGAVNYDKPAADVTPAPLEEAPTANVR